MTDKDESDKAARDVGEAAIERSVQGGLEILAKVEGVDELAEAAPYVGAMIKLVKWGLAKRDARRVRTFFQDLADLMDKDSAEEAAAHIAENMEHEWAQEGVVRGLRAIMEALDDNTRRCIAALVARYFVERSIPDLAYKRVAEFLADCDGHVLSSAYYVCDGFPEAAAEQGATAFYLTRNDDMRRVEWTPVVTTTAGETKLTPTTLGISPAYLDVQALLLSSRIAHSANLWSAAPALRVECSNAPLVLLLRDCMWAAGIETWEPDDA